MADPRIEEIHRQQQNIKDALQDASIPKFYMNGFNFGQSASDMFLAMNQVGKIFGILHMSFTTAKTLAIALQDAIAKFEKATEQPLLTMSEVQQRTEKAREEPAKQ